MLSFRSHRLLALGITLLVVALAACGGSTKATTTTTGASATPTTAAALIQATQLAPIATATAPGTPTPLANTLPSATTTATEASRATGAATTAATANVGTPTPLARTTANVGGVANTNTATSSATIVRATQSASSTATSVTTSATTSTITSATTSVSTSGSAVTSTGAVGTPTTTPVSASEARGATEQFLRTVLAKGDISGYLTPALKSQTGSDGYKLLNIQPPVQAFIIDSEQRDTDGNSATVQATITTASGVVKRTFVMHKQGNTWLVDNVLG